MGLGTEEGLYLDRAVSGGVFLRRVESKEKLGLDGREPSEPSSLSER